MEKLKQRVLERIRDHPGLNKTEIFEPFLDWRSKSYLNNLLNILEGEARIRFKKEPKAVYIYITQKGKRALKEVEYDQR
jgi:hypothetical protein